MAGEQSRCRILVMASGNGSNFQALVDAVADGRIPYSMISLLIVNRAKAYATTRADKAAIPWEYFNLISHGFLSKGERNEEKVRQARERYDAALAKRVLAVDQHERPDLVVLAGWMHVFGAEFLGPLERAGVSIINLHPALPGAYDGEHALKRAYNDFRAGKITGTGIMVHHVILDVDAGEPILVQEIEFREGEELAELEARVHGHEHVLIVRATAKVVEELVEAKRRK